MQQLLCRLVCSLTLLTALILLGAPCAADELPAGQRKSLVDFFLPMPPQGPLVEEGVWGAPNVLPRDVNNGLEDADLDQWCYWDGRIVKDDAGRFHMHASRWSQSFSHAAGWKQHSKAIHAVSDHIMGPYRDTGLLWPQWREGKGHNVIGLRMPNGDYAAITSEITDGEVFVSPTPEGPFKLLGKITWDANGFHPGLAAYRGGKGRMSNVKVLLRHDGRYMIIPRSTCTMVSDSGILGPYKIVHGPVYSNYPELPQTKNEDPTVWRSGGMYHIVYNHWPSGNSHHFSSLDGLTDWKYRGVAFKKKESQVFRYTTGEVNQWGMIERPTAYVDDDGHVSHFIFSVIDTYKGGDQANDQHGSKIVVVPFDGKAFDEHMQRLVAEEQRED